MQKNKTMLLIIMTLILSACGGGGGSNDNSGSGGDTIPRITSPTVDSVGILNNIQNTNLHAWGSTTEQHQNGNLKRWDYEKSLIPVKHKNEPLAIEAMNKIEDKLGYVIFDRDSLTNIADDDVTSGIIISIGTADYANINGHSALGACGLFSKGIPSLENPDNSHIPEYMYDINGAIKAKVYIHLGSSFRADCYQRRSGVTLHEFGHALGFASHFNGGFNGIGRYARLEDGTEVYYKEDPNDNFFNALKNIYNNPINTPKDDLVITQYF